MDNETKELFKRHYDGAPISRPDFSGGWSQRVSLKGTPSPEDKKKMMSFLANDILSGGYAGDLAVRESKESHALLIQGNGERSIVDGRLRALESAIGYKPPEQKYYSRPPTFPKP